MMKVAFHFDADHERFDRYDGLPVIKEIFVQLLREDINRLHLKVFTGCIDALDYLKDKQNREELWHGFLMPPRPVWQSLRPDFMEFLYNHKVFVVAFDGMGSRLRDKLHEVLLNDDTYLGVQQIHEANPAHWVLYGASMIPMYRITGRDLRILYSVGCEDEWDQALAVNFKNEIPFDSISFEEISVCHTILDCYSSYEHASRVNNLSNMLYDHLNLVSDQVMLRLTELAPDLYDRMQETLLDFEELDNPGGLSRAAESCSKMLSILAERLPVLEREGEIRAQNPVGIITSYICEKAKEEIQKDSLLLQLKDMTYRIDKYQGSQEMIPGENPLFEGGRLLWGLIIFLCDVLMLELKQN